MEDASAIFAFLPRGIRRNSLFLLFFGFALLFLMASTASATTWTVTGVTDSTTSVGTCNSTTHKCTTLRAAINAALGYEENETIKFAPTAYGTIALTSTLPTVYTSMTIQGPGANLLTISGGGAMRIFNITGGSVTISNLTLTKGVAAGSSFPNGYGGAILSRSGGSLSISGCALVDNSARGGHGGALYATGQVTVTNSTFSGNSAGKNGGAIQGETVSVTNSTFSGNSAGRSGGAIYAATLTVTNSTFSGNEAVGLGGAIYGTSGTLTVTNSIFSGNSADGGGGIAQEGTGNRTESYNLFYDNTGGDASFTLDSTDLSSSTSGKKVNLNPMLLPLGYYGGPTETMMPEPGSSAICAGDGADLTSALTAANSIDSSISTTADQRGFPIAPVEGACAKDGVDIGSVQTNYLLVTKTGDGSSTPGTLPYEISLAGQQDYTDIGFDLGTTAPATINLCPSGNCGSALPPSLYSGDTVIIGPPDAVTIDGGNGMQILNVSGSSTFATLYGLTFENGKTDDGGAIYNDGTLAVANSTFSDNSVLNAGSGGAIFNDEGGTLTVTNSTFYYNSAGRDGGAIRNYSVLTVTNSTFYHNSAGGRGGGAIKNSEGTLTAVDNIFEDNTASGSGGGIYNTTGTLAASYNLFNGNTPSGGVGQNVVTGDPTLASLGNYGGPTQTMLPLPGSAAICAGTPTLPSPLILPTTDQRGFPRLNITYTGFSASKPCIDIGAVQTNYQSIQFTNAPTDGYVAVPNKDVTPAPNVSVTENGQNIGGIPVTLDLSDFTGTSYTTSGLGPVTTVAGQGATFDSLTVSTTGTGMLSSTLDITPSISINTSPTPTLKVETADKAVVSYLNALYSEGVLNHGQYNSLDTEISQAIASASGSDFSGAINDVNDFISEVNDLYSSGVLTQQEYSALLTYANDLKTTYESHL